MRALDERGKFKFLDLTTHSHCATELPDLLKHKINGTAMSTGSIPPNAKFWS